jgi:hypothetical protein
VKVEIILYAFTVYVGVVLAVLLFGDNEHAERAQRAWQELLSLIKDLLGLINKNGADK